MLVLLQFIVHFSKPIDLYCHHVYAIPPIDA